MSHGFNPGLQVSEWAPVRRERLLPIDGDVLVQEGQHVTPGQTVAEAVLRGALIPINVAGSLGLPPEEVPAAMLKQVGDQVAEGELLAATKGVFGLFRSECRSPAAGVLASLSSATGQAMLEGPPVQVRVTAFIEGIVAEVRSRRGAVVVSGGTYVQGIFGVGGETHGPLVLAVSSPVEPLTEKDITAAMRGKVIVGGALATLGALHRAVEVGAAAVVVGGVHALDLRGLMGEEMGAAVTGSETLGLTLILTEGFGAVSMARRSFRLLGEREGFVASVSGATQIRAGVVRPEIVVPWGGGERPTAGLAAAAGAIALGSRVRLIRAPHFGALGVVIDLPAEPRRIASGALVRVLIAELESGMRVTVPRSNVEIVA